MALFQPTNITPDMKGGVANGVVYVPANPSTDTIAVSWTVNGNSPLVAYKIDFYKNDANSTYVTTTGKVTLGTPFSAISADGTETQFSVNLPYTLFGVTAGMETPKEGKIQITQWWGATDDESVVQKSLSVFLLTKNSTITISGPVLSNGEYVFTGTFTPPSSAYGSVTLNWTKWTAYYKDISGEWPIAASTGNVWGATSYTWSVSDLAPGDYEVIFQAEDSKGQQLYASTTFTALADATQAHPPVSVSCDKSKQAVSVQMTAIKNLTATFIGNPQNVNNELVITGSDSAAWMFPGNLTTAPWSFVWRGKISANGNPTFKITDSNGGIISFGYDNQAQSLVCTPTFGNIGNIQAADGDEIMAAFTMGTTPGTKNQFSWYITVIKNGSVFTTDNGVVSGYTQRQISKMELFAGTTEYWKVCYGNENGDIISAVTSGAFLDFYGMDVHYPYTHDTNLKTAQIFYFGDMVAAGVPGIYRVDDKNLLHYVGVPVAVSETDYETRIIYDYTALNQSSYRYAAIMRYPTAANENPVYLDPLSGSVTPCFWAWALIEADETNTAGLYQASAVYLFSANVSTSETANGNARNLYSTFTRYPVVMRNAQNRKSGNLSGLIGSISNGEYSDTNATMDAIFALSTSQKPLFLRSRRGEFMRISIAGEIKMSVADSTVKQQATASIPWVEIADASNVSVVDTGY